jgi:hypothetical protein
MNIWDVELVRELRGEAIRLAETFGREASCPGRTGPELEAAVEMQAAANHLGRVERCLEGCGAHAPELKLVAP